jgi:hypothetical protein
MKCVHCGTQNADDARHCRRCGAVLPLSTEVTAVLPPPEVADADRTHPLDEEPETGGTKPLHDSGPKSGRCTRAGCLIRVLCSACAISSSPCPSAPSSTKDAA